MRFRYTPDGNGGGPDPRTGSGPPPLPFKASEARREREIQFVVKGTPWLACAAMIKGSCCPDATSERRRRREFGGLHGATCRARDRCRSDCRDGRARVGRVRASGEPPPRVPGLALRADADRHGRPDLPERHRGAHGAADRQSQYGRPRHLARSVRRPDRHAADGGGRTARTSRSACRSRTASYRCATRCRASTYRLNTVNSTRRSRWSSHREARSSRPTNSPATYGFRAPDDVGAPSRGPRAPHPAENEGYASYTVRVPGVT